jgi:hypothetical protein
MRMLYWPLLAQLQRLILFAFAIELVPLFHERLRIVGRRRLRPRRLSYASHTHYKRNHENRNSTKEDFMPAIIALKIRGRAIPFLAGRMRFLVRCR